MGALWRGGTCSPALGQGALVFEGQEGPEGGRAGGCPEQLPPAGRPRGGWHQAPNYRNN